MVDITLRQSEHVFQIERRQNLTVQDGRRQVGRVGRQRLDDRVSQRLAALGVPFPVVQVVGGVLHEDRHHVLAGRRQSRIAEGWNHRLENGLGGGGAVLRVIVGSLQVLEAGADRYRAAQVLVAIRRVFELRQLAQREVYFRAAATVLQVANLARERRLQVKRLDQIEVGALRVGVRHDPRRSDLLAVGQRHPRGTSLFQLDPRHAGTRADLGAGATGKLGQRARECAHTTTHQAHGSDGPARRPGVLVHEREGRA